jgi:hypothetical protein
VTGGRHTRNLDPGLVYDRSAPQLLAALRALRTVPGPLESSQARALRAAAARTGRDCHSARPSSTRSVIVLIVSLETCTP